MHEYLEWLLAELIHTKDGIHDYEPDGIVPDKVETGMLRYFDAEAATAAGGLDEGFYYVDVNGDWQQLANELWVSHNFVVASFASLVDTTTPSAFPDIGLTYQTINAFDAEAVTSKGAVASIPNASIAPGYQGVWQMTLILSLSHNESNSGRFTYVRSYNLTDAIPDSNPVYVPIARNQPGTLMAISILLEILPADVNKEFVIQVGGGSALTSVIIENANYSLQHLDAAPVE